MIWGAHEVDGRVAAKAAVKLRAALRQSIDAKRLFQLYKESDPLVTDNEAQDNARARAWAMINMLPNNQALINALMYLWAEAFILGEDSATDAIRQARELKKAPVEGVDWANWKPGDRASALLITPPKAFQSLLSRSGVAIRGLDKTGYDRVGTALARSIRLGLGDTNAAKLINDAIGDPARALTIAITETNRAVSLGAMKTYREAGLEEMQWETSDPCPECVQNQGQIVQIGGTFNSGAQQPPAHPNCRCALLPVIPDYETNEAGVVDVAPIQPNSIPNPKPFHQPGVVEKWSLVPEDEKARLVARMREQRDAGFYENSPITSEIRGIFRGTEVNADVVIRGYQETWYRDMNATLRALPNRYPEVDFAPANDIMRRAINAAPANKEAFVGYRGVSDKLADLFLESNVGDVVVDKGFLSMSYRENTAKYFQYGRKDAVLFEIIVPEGTKGIDMSGFGNDITLGYMPYTEREFIAQAGSSLEIIEIDKTKRRIKAVLKQNG